MARETLESVSSTSCTRFSGFLAISSFGFNRLSSKLVDLRCRARAGLEPAKPARVILGTTS